MRLCSNVPAQSIVQTALGGHQSVKGYVNETGRVTRQRDFIYERLNAIPGITVKKPKAAFYCFPKIDIARFNIHDDMQFAYDLLRKERVLIVQGTGFNWPERITSVLSICRDAQCSQRHAIRSRNSLTVIIRNDLLIRVRQLVPTRK